jgi:hypothetical protein
MGKWSGPEVSQTSLATVIADLPPNVKKAFYAAANKGTIRRGTWDGCAFNAGGIEVGDINVRSTSSAAQTFGIDYNTVDSFIRIWDKTEGTDQEATNLLKKIIEEVGFFTSPEEARASLNKSGSRPNRRVVFKSQMVQFKEELATDTVELTNEAIEFLSSASGGQKELVNA